MASPERWRRDPQTGGWEREDGASVMLVTCRWQALSPAGDDVLVRDTAEQAMEAADEAWPGMRTPSPPG